MRQTLEVDASCQRAVNGWAAQRASDGLRACSVRTGAHCRVRRRLPQQMASTLARHTGRLLSEKARTQWLWLGRVVKLVDGAGMSMPDTPENQATYPQPSTHATGHGRWVPAGAPRYGGLLGPPVQRWAAIGSHRGQGQR